MQDSVHRRTAVGQEYVPADARQWPLWPKPDDVLPDIDTPELARMAADFFSAGHRILHDTARAAEIDTESGPRIIVFCRQCPRPK